ncbi:biotin transporter BioY [Candidatus Pelagibacter sp.]|jgi:biotin transport system substrate-specific component|nr:biotin transporter BioY [Candidatus Pelagibacter sp.]
MELTKNISQTKIIKSLLAVIFGSILLAVSSKIQTPFTLVPATMQTFVVLFLGMILGYKLAVYSVILYLLQGSIGLPVFAKGGGIAYLMGPTGGYLIGFIFTAFLAGKIKIKNDPIIIFIYLLFAVSISYILGLCGLWNYLGLNKSFNEVFLVGAQPFLIIEIYKILILAVLSNQITKLRNFI